MTSSLSETRVDSQEKRLAQMENEMKSVFDHVMRRSARILQEALLVARVPNLTISDECMLSCGLIRQGALQDSDVVVRVDWAEQQKGAQCPTNVAAYAAACCRDQWDRPIAGIIWICPRMLDFISKAVESRRGRARFEFAALVLCHEIAHVLAVDEQLFNLFRKMDGTPVVPRRGDGTPSASLFEANTRWMATPHVQAAVRQHFNCSSLRGALMHRNHWNQRVFNTELMAGSHHWPFQPQLSPLTLALFNDSGWYKARANKDTMRWGRDWGCAFAQGRQLLTPKMFCAFTENDSASCGKTSTKPFGLGVEEGNWDIMMSTIFGQVKEHANSVCMQTTLHRRGFGENFQSEAARAKFLQKLKRLSLCFAFRCHTGRAQVMISDQTWRTCSDEGNMTAKGFDGAVTCPSNTCRVQFIGSLRNISITLTGLLLSAIIIWKRGSLAMLAKVFDARQFRRGEVQALPVNTRELER